MIARWIFGELRRRPGYAIAMAATIALAVAFTASLGAFLVFVRTQVETKAAADVDVDWQVQLARGADPSNVLHTIASSPGVERYALVGYGDTVGFQASTGGTVQTTGPGKIVGLDPKYRALFAPEIRNLVGSGSGVLLAQQTAANLRAGPGDEISATLPTGRVVRMRVDGVVDLPRADSFFQVVGAAPGAGPQAPPDNVVLLPLARWTKLFDPATGSGAYELHLHLKRHLPRDPSKAYAELTAIRKNDEAKLAGAAMIGDNLTARLGGARTDAAYGELLFAFLGVPGVALAIAIIVLIALAGAERRRADQALLRIRGARPRTIVTLATAEGLAPVIVGTLGGIAVAGLVAMSFWRLGPTKIASPLVVGGVVGVVAGLAALAVPAWRNVRTWSIRRSIAIEAPDVRSRGALIAIAAAFAMVAGLAVWYTTRRGYDVVVAPEGVATVSVSYLALAGPALAWPAALLVLATSGGAILRAVGRPAAALVSGLTKGLAALVPAWLARVRAVALRPVLLIALAVAFAVSTSIFDTSFAHQSQVDAELTNGADVSAQAPPGVDLARSAQDVAPIAGVGASALMRHRFAYVGNDLQDLYGVTPQLTRATSLSDAYFADGHAAQQISALGRTRDGVFIADETLIDYALHRGDPIFLRVLDVRTHRYTPVPFHVLGVVREFPTAPTDSFLVANASYLRDVTHSDSYETLLVRSNGRSPRSVAADVRHVVPAGATVQDIVSERRIIASGLVAVDVHGLMQIEIVFATLAALAGVALLLALTFAERRRSFVILRVLRVTARQITGIAGAEAASVVFVGGVAGAAFGGAIGFILVKVLRGIFDPPPQHPLVPWTYLVALAFGITVVAVAATAFGVRRGSRTGPSELRSAAL